MLDIGITEDGDLMFDVVKKDLVPEKGDALRAQLAFCRMKSIEHDWYKDHIGANLEELIGMPNDESTLNLGVNKIIESLSYDELYNIDEIHIEPSNNDENSISYDVFLRNFDRISSVLIRVEIDLIKGVNIQILD